jgi:hypothetical protein
MACPGTFHGRIQVEHVELGGTSNEFRKQFLRQTFHNLGHTAVRIGYTDTPPKLLS